MSDCGCGSNNKKQRGPENTQLTIISGESANRLRQNEGDTPLSKKPGSKDATIVLGCIAIVAAIVGYTSFSDSNKNK